MAILDEKCASFLSSFLPKHRECSRVAVLTCTHNLGFKQK